MVYLKENCKEEEIKRKMIKTGFNYNFDVCPICGKEMTYGDNVESECENKCIRFDIDPQGETVTAYIDDKWYLLPLHETSVLVEYGGNIDWNDFVIRYLNHLLEK